MQKKNESSTIECPVCFQEFDYFPRTSIPSNTCETSSTATKPSITPINKTDPRLVYNPKCQHIFCLECLDHYLLCVSATPSESNASVIRQHSNHENHDDIEDVPVTTALNSCPMCRRPMFYFDLQYCYNNQPIIDIMDDESYNDIILRNIGDSIYLSIKQHRQYANQDHYETDNGNDGYGMGFVSIHFPPPLRNDDDEKNNDQDYEERIHFDNDQKNENNKKKKSPRPPYVNISKIKNLDKNSVMFENMPDSIEMQNIKYHALTKTLQADLTIQVTGTIGDRPPKPWIFHAYHSWRFIFTFSDNWKCIARGVILMSTKRKELELMEKTHNTTTAAHAMTHDLQERTVDQDHQVQHLRLELQQLQEQIPQPMQEQLLLQQLQLEQHHQQQELQQHHHNQVQQLNNIINVIEHQNTFDPSNTNNNNNSNNNNNNNRNNNHDPTSHHADTENHNNNHDLQSTHENDPSSVDDSGISFDVSMSRVTRLGGSSKSGYVYRRLVHLAQPPTRGTRLIAAALSESPSSGSVSAPQYISDTLWGNVFCQGLKVGLASYHFVDETNSFISYEHFHAATQWPPLDNGAPIPSRVLFSNIQYNKEQHTLNGSICWMQDYGTTWQGVSQWNYEMKFDSNYITILSGSVKSILGAQGDDRHNKEDKTEISRFGVNLLYCNAALFDYFRNHHHEEQQQDEPQQGQDQTFLSLLLSRSRGNLSNGENNYNNQQPQTYLHRSRNSNEVLRSRLLSEGMSIRILALIDHIWTISQSAGGQNPIDYDNDNTILTSTVNAAP